MQKSSSSNYIVFSTKKPHQLSSLPNDAWIICGAAMKQLTSDNGIAGRVGFTEGLVRNLCEHDKYAWTHGKF